MIEESHYISTGDHSITCKVWNTITPEIEVTENIEILKEILAPDVVLEDPLVKPTDTVTFTVTAVEGTRVTIDMSCTDGHTVSIVLSSYS